MIDYHAWPTPNGIKISIMLEECGLPYRAIPVDIRAGAQFKPEFLKIGPNNRIPAIVDPEGPEAKPLALFESGAILIYLADKCGKFLAAKGDARYTAIQWLMFQMGGIGPMFGQFNHFAIYAPEPVPYARQRYENESNRLLGVLDKRLGEAAFMAGGYSIADMATWLWVRNYIRHSGHGLDDFPNTQRWYGVIDARPGVKRGLELLAAEREMAAKRGVTPEAREILFGQTQYQKR